MGSVQQISIGIVCLVAAFAFGNYVNTHPLGGHPNDAAQVDSDSAQSVGNVQSRLTDGIELIQKRPAPIATMRNRPQPRFSMPSTGSTPAADFNNNPNPLPPPSQLAKIEPGNPSGSNLPIPMTTPDELASTGVTPKVPKASDVPDFSSIMNELATTPIGLKPLGRMPQHSNPNQNRTAQAIAQPRGNDANTPLKDLVKEFKMATLPRANDVAILSDQQRKPGFSADDFAPQLHDRSTSDVALEANQTNADNTEKPITTATDAAANQPEFILGRSNHVVSREPIPPASFGQKPKSDSAPRLARIETAGNSSSAAAQDRLSQSISRKTPFGLNDQGKQQLAAIKSRASSQLALNTTRFVEHVVQPGETLQSISKRYFGDPDYYLDIYLANRNKLRNPVTIETGTALRIPIYQ